MNGIFEETVCLWSYLNERKHLYINPFYDPKMKEMYPQLNPDTNVLSMKIWKECFLYYANGYRDQY